MLAIRMQRTGRKGHPEFRIIVQESALSPSSGRVVARLGHHNPHTKETVLNTEKVVFYLENGAQPSERVVKLLKDQKVKLPKWVEDLDTKKAGKIRNPEKLRRNQPEEPAAEEPNETPADDAATESTDDKAEEATPEEKTDEPAEEPATEETVEEAAPEEAQTEEAPAETEEKSAE